MTGEQLYKLIKEFLGMCDLLFHDMDDITVEFKDRMIVFKYESSDRQTHITWEYKT